MAAISRWWGAGLLLATGCFTSFGDYTIADSCVLNSDCPSGDVCLFKTCSSPCKEDRDCATGRRCLSTAKGVGCVDPGSSACGSTCPEGTACDAHGVCRTACDGAMGLPCLAGQSCVGSVCVGLDPAHDAGALGGGGGAGAAGGGGKAGAAGTSGKAGSGVGGSAGMPACPTGWTCTDKTGLHGSFLWDRETRFGSWYDAKLTCMGLATDPAYGNGPWHPALVQEYKTILPLDGNVMPHLPSTQKIDMWTGATPSGAPGLGAIIKIWLNMGSYDVEVLEVVLPYHCVRGVP